MSNIYKFIKSECGSGKTHAVVKMINSSTEKFLIVQGKIDLLNQTFAQISDAKMITSQTHTSNVDKSINEFLIMPSSRVLGVTAKSFFKIDPVLLSGWKVILDDVVTFHNFKSINEGNHKIKSLLEEDIFKVAEAVNENYNLVQKNKEVNGELVQLISSSFEMIDINDHFIINNSYFNKKNRVLVSNVTISTYDEGVKQLTMLGWIDIAKYSQCDLTFMANKFDESLLYKSNPGMFSETSLNGLRKRSLPVSERLKVKYFSKSKVLSKTFRNEHREYFDKVVQYINAELDGQQYYYTRNNSESFSMGGEYVPVDTRGMNNLQNYSTCVWMASCRPSPVEIKITELFFNITGEDLVRSREYESLEQFVQRGCLRDFNSTDVMTIYVFDEQQALSLGTENIEYIDLGIDDIQAGKVGRPSSEVPIKLRNGFSQWLSRNSGNAGSTEIIEAYKQWKNKQLKKYSDVDFSTLDNKIWDISKR